MAKSAEIDRASAGAGLLPRGRWRRHRWAAAVAAAVVAFAATAHAVKIRGEVEGFMSLLNPVWDEARDPSRHLYSFREPVPTIPAKYRKPFPHIPKELCVAALASEKQPPQEPVLIRVGGGRTTPVTIVVTPGTQLQFENTDPFVHRLYGVGIKTFNPADTGKGGTRTWQVPEPGTYEIRDEAAPSLRMWVVAEPKVKAIAYPSLEGEFVISVRDPGDYTLQPYFAGEKVGDPLAITVGTAPVNVSKAPIDVAPENEKAD